MITQNKFNQIDKIALSREEAAYVLGISIPTLDLLIRREEFAIPFFRVGKGRTSKVLLPVSGIKQWVTEECERQKRMDVDIFES